MTGERCNDKRKCFGRRGDYCGILVHTGYKNGACPFAKPEREVTDGKRYPYSPSYSQYGNGREGEE